MQGDAAAAAMDVEQLVDPLVPEDMVSLGNILPQPHDQQWHDFMNQSTVIYNVTVDLNKMLQCFDQYIQSRSSPEFGPGACPVKFDGVSCWPETPPGHVRVIRCFDMFNGVRYDPSDNATLLCFPNGTWSSNASYADCHNLQEHGVSLEREKMTYINQIIFYFGYSLSLAAVTLALFIFLSLKDLRCLRNTIHANLLSTYLLHNLFWIICASIQTLVPVSVNCSFLVFLNYFTLTSFLWMFVEGFYLYMLVVKTFSVDNIKLRMYTLIGWGVPVPIIIVWVAVKSTHPYQPGTPLEETGMESHMSEACSLIHLSTVDWIHRVPVLVFLSLNVLFLMQIMWVLITKLRSANTAETQRYRKAAKALLVLNPLLGLTYMLFIATPGELAPVVALLLSTQGFFVALFYCFLNNEVQNSVRHHLERWKTSRGLTDRRTSSTRRGREVSPLSRSRYFSYGRRMFGGKRESVSMCSEVTTLSTVVTANNNHTVTTTTLPLPPRRPSEIDADATVRDSLL